MDRQPEHVHFRIGLAVSETGAEVTPALGRDQTDADRQIQAIENAESRDDSAILIANNGAHDQ